MKRKYKLILIILISVVFTYLIYFWNSDDKLNIVSLGDGIASGETSYNIDGLSYNNYIKDYYESKKLLKNYNDYSNKNYKLSELINDIKNNIKDDNNELQMKQVLHNADLITICYGEEELTALENSDDLDTEKLTKFLTSFESLLYLLKDISTSKIVIVGLYENQYLDKSDIIILNSELSNLANRFNAVFIDISELMLDKEYFLDNKTLYFSYKGHLEIANMIIHSI